MTTHKYLEIEAWLREQCAHLPEGTRLDGERQLSKRFGVSPMTVRQALTALAADGWIRRVRGSGTFVSQPMRRVVTMGPGLTSFTQDMRLMGLEPSSKVIRFEELRPDWDIMAKLQMRGQETALRLERLRFADGEPMSHEVAYFPAVAKAALSVDRLESSTHQCLIDHGVIPVSVFRRVRAVPLPDEECELLNVDVGSPGLEIVDIFVDIDNRPIEYVTSRYRFDRYEVIGNLQRIK